MPERLRPPDAGEAVPEYALKLSDAELARYQQMAETAARAERDLWAAAGVAEGAVVADVGCGPGAVSVVLAQQVGPAGRVLAVDGEALTVEAAQAAASRAGVDNISATAGQAHDTGIAPGSVDLVMIRHVLAHNGGLEEAIVAHAASLVRPDGVVYLVDTDADGIRMRPPDPDLVDLGERYLRWHRQRGNDVSVGLRLSELLTGAGLEGIEHHGRYEIFPAPSGWRSPGWAGRTALADAGLATSDDIDRWSAAYERFDRAEERPTMFVPVFVAFGHRPSS